MNEFASVQGLLAEHAEIETALGDPDVHADPGRARQLGRRYAELGRIVAAYHRWEAAGGDAQAARELGADDPAFAAEVADLEAVETEAAAELRRVLVPRDPDEGGDVILQVKAGEGGAEGAWSAGELLRMYRGFAERESWSAE